MKHIIITIGLILFTNSLTGKPIEHHDHSKNVEWAGVEFPTLDLRVERYDNSGWVVIYKANNFNFSAENASSIFEHFQDMWIHNENIRPVRKKAFLELNEAYENSKK